MGDEQLSEEPVLGGLTPVGSEEQGIKRMLLCCLLSVVVLIPAVLPAEKVGGNLLEKIHTTVQKEETSKGIRNRYQQFPRPRVSVLERARSRQQQLLGVRSPNRSPNLKPTQNIPFSNKNRLLGGECQAFMTENRILKQQLNAVKQELQQLERRMGAQLEGPVRALQLLSKIQESVTEKPYKEVVKVTSSLVSHSPVISTILETTSFLTTVTETLTRELLVNFHGKKLPTQILDVEVQVQNVTSVISSTVEITPTPTWETVTVTTTVPNLPQMFQQPQSPEQLPTPYKPQTTHKPEAPLQHPALRQSPAPRIEDVLSKTKKGIQKLLGTTHIEQPRSLGTVNDNLKALGTFESFQAYLQNIQALERGEKVSYLSGNSEAPPTSSISTLYVSGSVPGQFSTILITGNPNQGTKPANRAKRQISPSRPEPVASTSVPQSSDIFHTDPNNIEIISSFTPEVSNSVVGGINKVIEECCEKTVTIMVTKTVACQP